MAYTDTNFPTKKALKEYVASGKPMGVWQPGPLGTDMSTFTGRVSVEGPQYPQPHKWYADCEVKDGVIVKVK